MDKDEDKLMRNDLNRKIFPNFFSDRFSKKLNKKDEQFLKELLFLACTDLAAADTLYDRKLYPQAIYFLQQSIEKATKAEYLRDGTIDIYSLKKEVGHNTPQLLLIGAIENIKEMAKIKGKDFSEQIHKLNEILNLRKKRGIENMAPLALSEDSKQLIDYISPKKFELEKNYHSVGSNIIHKKERDLIKKGDKIYLNLKIELAALSNIFAPHFNTTRYPNDLISPQAYFDGKISIVKEFENIAKQVADILFIMDPLTMESIYKKGAFGFPK